MKESGFYYPKTFLKDIVYNRANGEKTNMFFTDLADSLMSRLTNILSD